VQNFAFCRKSEPHEEHFAVFDGFETSDGSGGGSVPALSKAVAVAITDAGPPTGFCAVPGRVAGIPPGIIPGVPIPGIKPGDCVPPSAEPPVNF